MYAEQRSSVLASSPSPSPDVPDGSPIPSYIAVEDLCLSVTTTSRSVDALPSVVSEGRAITTRRLSRETSLQAFCFVVETEETTGRFAWYYAPLADYDRKKLRVDEGVVRNSLSRQRDAAESARTPIVFFRLPHSTTFRRLSLASPTAASPSAEAMPPKDRSGEQRAASGDVDNGRDEETKENGKEETRQPSPARPQGGVAVFAPPSSTTPPSEEDEDLSVHSLATPFFFQPAPAHPSASATSTSGSPRCPPKLCTTPKTNGRRGQQQLLHHQHQQQQQDQEQQQQEEQQHEQQQEQLQEQAVGISREPAVSPSPVSVSRSSSTGFGFPTAKQLSGFAGSGHESCGGLTAPSTTCSVGAEASASVVDPNTSRRVSDSLARTLSDMSRSPLLASSTGTATEMVFVGNHFTPTPPPTVPRRAISNAARTSHAADTRPPHTSLSDARKGHLQQTPTRPTIRHTPRLMPAAKH